MKRPSRTELELLATLGTRRLSGRDLAKLYEKETDRSISYGTLYTTMARLRDQGWVEQQDSEDEDGRLRYFLITGAGITVLNEERRQLDALLVLLKKEAFA
jgi:DNA-binding PadR family transcriptional regulator